MHVFLESYTVLVTLASSYSHEIGSLLEPFQPLLTHSRKAHMQQLRDDTVRNGMPVLLMPADVGMKALSDMWLQLSNFCAKPPFMPDIHVYQNAHPVMRRCGNSVEAIIRSDDLT